MSCLWSGRRSTCRHRCSSTSPGECKPRPRPSSRHSACARHVIALTLLRDLGEQNQSDLPATLGMDPTNVVALLNELEADDLVQRRRSPQDRRRHTVSLTAAGRARLSEIEDRLTGVEQRVLDPLTPAEQQTLYALLSRATSSATCAEALAATRACTKA